jgi:hypothetical protein
MSLLTDRGRAELPRITSRIAAPKSPALEV